MPLAERLRLPASDTVAGRAGRQAVRAAEVLAAHPRAVVGSLVGIQWLALLAFALTVRHNGWLYYQGGDQTFYYSTSWLLSDWTLPVTPIGYGWPYLMTPVSTFAGPSVLHALPWILILNALVLVPIAVVCMYGIGARIGGRLIGYLAAALWVALPYAAIPLFDQRFHQKYVEWALPQSLGLSALSDFPSTVVILVSAYYTLRALDGRAWGDAAIAGLAAGFAVGIKPANGIFVAAPVLALVVARHWRQTAVLIGALAPAVVTLTIWKSRGLGDIPALALGGGHLAAFALALPLALGFDSVSKYVHLDWGQFGRNLDQLREFFWSVRPLEWAPVAGTIALFLRVPAKAVLVGVWFFGYILVKGTSSNARVEDASFFRLVMPAFPAFVVLLAAIPLLVPTLGAVLRQRYRPAPPRPHSLRVVAAAAAAFAFVPLVLVGAAGAQSGPRVVKYFAQNVFVPNDRFAVDAKRTGRAVSLSWPGQKTGATDVFYRVFRSPASGLDPDKPYVYPPLIKGVNCVSEHAGGAADCRLKMDTIAVTPGTGFVDHPPPGDWSYRIGVSANWLDDTNLGDVVLVSRPATVKLG
jgi:hypothetical protein